MQTVDDKFVKDSHCSYCGSSFTEKTLWPRMCFRCYNMSFKNPMPVSVMIVPVIGHGYLIQRRGIEPKKGEWALPGGFIEANETWQHAAVRELKEEMNLDTKEEDFSLTEIKSDNDNHMLIFCMHKGIRKSELNSFLPNEEVLEYKFVNKSKDVNLCFSTHQDVLKSLLLDDEAAEFSEAFDKEDIDTV